MHWCVAWVDSCRLSRSKFSCMFILLLYLYIVLVWCVAATSTRCKIQLYGTTPFDSQEQTPTEITPWIAVMTPFLKKLSILLPNTVPTVCSPCWTDGQRTTSWFFMTRQASCKKRKQTVAVARTLLYSPPALYKIIVFALCICFQDHERVDKIICTAQKQPERLWNCVAASHHNEMYFHFRFPSAYARCRITFKENHGG